MKRFSPESSVHSPDWQPPALPMVVSSFALSNPIPTKANSPNESPIYHQLEVRKSRTCVNIVHSFFSVFNVFQCFLTTTMTTTTRMKMRRRRRQRKCFWKRKISKAWVSRRTLLNWQSASRRRARFALFDTPTTIPLRCQLAIRRFTPFHTNTIILTFRRHFIAKWLRVARQMSCWTRRDTFRMTRCRRPPHRQCRMSLARRGRPCRYRNCNVKMFVVGRWTFYRNWINKLPNCK